MRKVFCDTSFFYAALDATDADHREAIALSHWIRENKTAVYTTWEVVLETVTLLRYRLSYLGALSFVETVLPTLNLIYIQDSDRSNALATFIRLSKDKKLSLCDVISYIVVKKRLRNIPCLAFDDDFQHLGLNVIHLP